MFWLNNLRKHYFSYTVGIKCSSISKAKLSTVVVFHYLAAEEKNESCGKIFALAISTVVKSLS